MMGSTSPFDRLGLMYNTSPEWNELLHRFGSLNSIRFHPYLVRSTETFPRFAPPRSLRSPPADTSSAGRTVPPPKPPHQLPNDAQEFSVTGSVLARNRRRAAVEGILTPFRTGFTIDCRRNQLANELEVNLSTPPDHSFT